MKDIYLPVTVGGVTFKNPFYVASGPTAKKVKQLVRIEETGWAAASIKLTIAPEPYINRMPRYGYFPDLNALSFSTEKRLNFEEGLRLVDEGKKQLKELLLFANISYAGPDGLAGWVDMARQFESVGADIIELNMCCPNMSYNLELTTGDDDASDKKSGASLGQDAKAVAEIVSAIKHGVRIPLFVKLTPEGGEIGSIAKALFEAGADAVGSTANRMGMPPIDLDAPGASAYHLQDELSLACQCGPWLTPLAQRDTYEIRKACGPDVSITATGGIAKWNDAVRMIMCGADLIGVCSETLISGYDIVRPMIEGLKEYMGSKSYKEVGHMRDLIVPRVKTAAEITQHKGYAKILNPELAGPCKAACPHHVPAQAYIQSIAKKDFKKAFDLITSKDPLQYVCAYICFSKCETACTRGQIGRPLRIRDLKRFVLDYGAAKGWKTEISIIGSSSKRVAVIGSGPAGLSCAFSLALAGYRVTVFEREPEFGGALRSFVSSSRIPGHLVDDQIKMLENMGVILKNRTEYGKDITADSLKKDGFESVFLGIGKQKDFISVDPETLEVIKDSEVLEAAEISTWGVYAGGNAVKADSVIAAIAAGKRAAVSIDKHLRGADSALEYDPVYTAADPCEVLAGVPFSRDDWAENLQKNQRPKKHSNHAGEHALTEEEAVKEAARCLNCGCGEGCQLCKTICCEFSPVIAGTDRIEIIKEDCTACGMCYARCPNHNIEMIRTDMRS